MSGGKECFVVEANRVMSRDAPECLGEIIELPDGRKMQIKGVERFLPNAPIRIGERIGLWVERIN